MSLNICDLSTTQFIIQEVYKEELTILLDRNHSMAGYHALYCHCAFKGIFIPEQERSINEALDTTERGKERRGRNNLTAIFLNLHLNFSVRKRLGILTHFLEKCLLFPVSIKGLSIMGAHIIMY
jgi:hypothetical protein